MKHLMIDRRWISGLLTGLALTAGLAGASLTASAAKRSAVLVGFKFIPARVKGGQSTNLRIALTDPAPAGGITVTLGTDNPKIAPIPKKIVVPAGVRNYDLTINTHPVTADTRVTLTSSDAKKGRKDTLTVTK